MTMTEEKKSPPAATEGVSKAHIHTFGYDENGTLWIDGDAILDGLPVTAWEIKPVGVASGHFVEVTLRWLLT